MPDDEHGPGSISDETGQVGRVAAGRTPETRPGPDKHPQARNRLPRTARTTLPHEQMGVFG